MADPTVVTGGRVRTSYAVASDPLIGREDTQFAEDVALEVRWKNPLTLLTMKLSRARSRTVDVHYFGDQYLPYRDQINSATGYIAASTSLVVDHGEYFAVGDLVRHVSGADEIMLVTAVSSDTLTVTRDFGQSTEGWTALATTMADNDYLEILGNAFEQGHPFPTVRTTTDVEYINYCQDLRTPVAMSEVARDTKLRAGQDWPYQIKKAAEEHQDKMERQNWLGKPYRGDLGLYASGTGNTAPTEGGGVNHYIATYTDSARKVDQDDLTEWEFWDWMEVAMEKGSKTKYLWCPPKLRTAFDKWGITRLNTYTNETIYGMAVGRIQSSHGDIILMTHDYLKAYASTLYNYCFLLDMEQLSFVTFGPNGSTRLRPAGNHDQTGETLDRSEFQTISCIILKQPNYHGRLRFKTYST